MSSLKERLGRLKKSPDKPAIPETKPLGDCWEKTGASICSNELGQFLMRKIRYPFDYAHGMYRLGELRGGAGVLSFLHVQAPVRKSRKASPPEMKSFTHSAGDMAIPPVSHERLLFLDTETTGLGVGAGNVPFMIGIGFYEPDAFIVEQLFIRNPAEEAAMLHHLSERLAERDLLVSYNGKCFDWPIIKNRYILNRQKEGAIDPPHFDFLYPSRSLWRNTLPSCRLSSVERERLGLSRVDDVPGSLAPALYFQFLSEGDPTLLAGVFEHNEKDVLTLACLAVHFVKLIDGGVSRTEMEAEELFRLALWLEKLGRADQADDAFKELLGRGPDEASNYWLSAAARFKRQGDYESAVQLWEQTIERKKRSRTALLEPYVELAMYYEHQRKDYDKALMYAEQALNRMWGRLSAFRKGSAASEQDQLDALRKRVDRLLAKRESAKRPPSAVPTHAFGANVHSRNRRSRRANATADILVQTLL